MTAYALTELPNGSLLLTKEEVKQLEKEINSLLQQTYKAGSDAGQEEIKSNTKLCPKNI